MEGIIVDLINRQQSSENNVRVEAEIEFSNLVQQDPSQTALILINLSVNQNIQFPLRQASLLHLKRIVPRFWSLSFQSFIGPPVSQDVKLVIRESLLNLATLDQDSKIRSSAAYCIVQVAATDFPDEWPTLMDQLFEKSSNLSNPIEMLGGITVLHDLFDDLVSEEQFFEGGVGLKVIDHTMALLGSNEVSSNVKTQVAKLYKICLNQFQSPEAFASEKRQSFMDNHIPQIIHLVTNLLNDTLINGTYTVRNIHDVLFRTELYKIVIILLTHFKKKYAQDAKAFLQDLIIKNLNVGSDVFVHTIVLDDKTVEVNNPTDLDFNIVLENLIVEIFQTLGSIYNLPLNSELLPSFVDNIINVSLLPLETQEQWVDDFNIFVCDASGMSSGFSARDGINEYLSELNDADSSMIFEYLLSKLESFNEKTEWQLKEAILFMFESLFVNDDTNLSNNVPVVQLLNKLVEFLKDDHLLVRARACLMLPRFLEKFSENIATGSFGSKTFMKNLTTGYEDKTELVRAASLIASTYYKHILNLSVLTSESQTLIINIITSLIGDAEDDTLSILLEALTTAIEINPKVLACESKALELIFQISFNEPSNIQLTVDSKDSLRALLCDIDATNYASQCQKGLPSLIDIVQSTMNKSASVEYSPELDLALELLTIFISSSPTEFPEEVFNFIFPAISQLLIKASDDQILQNGGEVFNEILQKASDRIIGYQNESNESGLDIILRIVAKLLSPDLSDSAATNVGSIVVSLVEKFQSHLGEYLPQILEAATKRLIVAKELITIEDLITVFCYLVLLSPEDTINFLSGLRIDNKSGLEIVFPIWFESYEVTRGYEKIKKNTLALGKIFSLGDERIENLIVDGELIEHEVGANVIVTRSMAASLPIEYTKISASLKILRLLLSELNFQSQQPKVSDYLPGSVERVDEEDSAADGWEDLDDIGVPNYEKLRSYIESDEEGDERDQQNGDDGLRQILVQFFKECAVKNLGNFKKYYEMLDFEDKKFLTENVIF